MMVVRKVIQLVMMMVEMMVGYSVLLKVVQ